MLSLRVNILLRVNRDSILSGCDLLFRWDLRVLRIIINVAVSDVGIFLLVLECEEQIDISACLSYLFVDSGNTLPL